MVTGIAWVLQGLSLLFALLWTINWFRFRTASRGHSAMITDVILLWATNIAFLLHPEWSRFHLLWVVPACLIVGFFLALIVFRR